MSDYSFRAPTEDDIGALAQLHFYMWNDFYSDFLPKDYSKKFYTLEQCHELEKEMVTACLTNPEEHFALIAEKDGQLAALSYTTKNVPTGYDLDIPGFDAELQRIYTVPGHRSQGLGSAMLALRFDWLKQRNCRSAFLWTFDRNPYARFYPKKGAEIIKKMDRDYDGTSLGLTAYGWKDIGF